MSGRKIHKCPEKWGEPQTPAIVQCGGNPNHSWCENCDPCPSALCPWCNGRGYSTDPIPKRQRIAAGFDR